MAIIPVLGSRGRKVRSSRSFWPGLCPERKNTIGPCRDERPATEGEVCPWEPRPWFPMCRPSQVSIPPAEAVKGPPGFIWFYCVLLKFPLARLLSPKGFVQWRLLSNLESFPDPVPRPPHFLGLVFGLQWERRSGIENREGVERTWAWWLHSS